LQEGNGVWNKQYNKAQLVQITASMMEVLQTSHTLLKPGNEQCRLMTLPALSTQVLVEKLMEIPTADIKLKITLYPPFHNLKPFSHPVSGTIPYKNTTIIFKNLRH